MEKKEQIKKVSQIILEYLNDSPDLEEAKSETIFMARDIDALYSDPPSPEMVCPQCKEIIRNEYTNEWGNWKHE